MKVFNVLIFLIVGMIAAFSLKLWSDKISEPSQEDLANAAAATDQELLSLNKCEKRRVSDYLTNNPKLAPISHGAVLEMRNACNAEEEQRKSDDKAISEAIRQESLVNNAEK